MSGPGLDHRGLPAGYRLRPGVEVSPREVKAAMEDAASGAVVVDCRTPEEWDVARVPGAVLIPLHELDGRLDELEEAKDKPVMVLCHHGVRSLKAALLLQHAGFAGARSMAGGIELWSLDVDPSVPRYDRSSGRCVVMPAGFTEP